MLNRLQVLMFPYLFTMVAHYAYDSTPLVALSHAAGGVIPRPWWRYPLPKVELRPRIKAQKGSVIASGAALAEGLTTSLQSAQPLPFSQLRPRSKTKNSLATLQWRVHHVVCAGNLRPLAGPRRDPTRRTVPALWSAAARTFININCTSVNQHRQHTRSRDNAALGLTGTRPKLTVQASDSLALPKWFCVL